MTAQPNEKEMTYGDISNAVASGQFDWIEDKARKRAEMAVQLLCGGRFYSSLDIDKRLTELGFTMIEPLGGFNASLWERGKLRLLVEMDVDYTYWFVTPMAKPL